MRFDDRKYSDDADQSDDEIQQRVSTVRQDPPTQTTTTPNAMLAQQRHQRRSMTISVTLLGVTLCAVMLAYLVFGDTNDEQALSSVRQVHILFRHGDRNPTEAYPLDPHKAYAWPGGLGALTTVRCNGALLLRQITISNFSTFAPSQKGALQTYTLGRNLHQRYFRLLPPNSLYTRDNMLVLSSAAERCLASASAMLAGLMPPLEGRHQLPLEWQPVPVASLARADDTLLAQKKACPRYDAALLTLWTQGTPELRELHAKNADLFAYLSKHTGLVTRRDILIRTKSMIH